MSHQQTVRRTPHPRRSPKTESASEPSSSLHPSRLSPSFHPCDEAPVAPAEDRAPETHARPTTSSDSNANLHLSPQPKHLFPFLSQVASHRTSDTSRVFESR